MDQAKYRILQEILARKAVVSAIEIGPDTDLFEDLDIDSLCLVEAFMEIQTAFGITLHPANLAREQFNTPSKILALITQSTP